MTEMDVLNRIHGCSAFDFQDDTFTLSRDHTLRLVEHLAKRQYTWSCETRADRADRELLTRMRDAGCKHIRIGLETAHQASLDLIQRKITREAYDKFFRLAADLGISVRPSIMIGIPGETSESVLKTIEYISQLPFDGPVAAWCITPIPGTELHEQREQYSISIEAREFSEYSPHRAAISTAQLKRNEIDRLTVGAQYLLGVCRKNVVACRVKPVAGSRAHFDGVKINADVLSYRFVPGSLPELLCAGHLDDASTQILVCRKGEFYVLNRRASVFWFYLIASGNIAVAINESHATCSSISHHLYNDFINLLWQERLVTLDAISPHQEQSDESSGDPDDTCAPGETEAELALFYLGDMF